MSEHGYIHLSPMLLEQKIAFSVRSVRNIYKGHFLDTTARFNLQTPGINKFQLVLRVPDNQERACQSIGENVTEKLSLTQEAPSSLPRTWRVWPWSRPTAF